MESSSTKADHQPPRHRPVGPPDPPKQGGGEDRQQQLEAQLRLDVGVVGEEDPGRGRKPRADDPGGEDHPLGVDAGEPGEVGRVGHCAHRLAGPGVAEQQVHRQHQDEGGADDGDMLGEDAQRVEEQPGKLDALAEGAEPRAPDELHEGAHHQHQPEGGDHEDDGRAVAEWPEEEPVHAEHRERGERHCQGKDGEGVPAGEGGE